MVIEATSAHRAAQRKYGCRLAHLRISFVQHSHHLNEAMRISLEQLELGSLVSFTVLSRLLIKER